MFRVLESMAGWKVVWSIDRPRGATISKCRNWSLIQDGMKRVEAEDFCRRWNGPCVSKSGKDSAQ